MPTSEQIAWAGGFFEGEGWAGRGHSYTSSGKMYYFCRAMINQKFRGPLQRFKKSIGFGKIAGPYKSKGRCPLYVWRVENRAEVQKLCDLLTPFISARRKQQFKLALRRS